MRLKSFTPSNLIRKSRILIDGFLGLDFLNVVQPEEVGLDSERVYRSSPSGDKYLKKLLLDFNISSQDSIIDIGCGKGSAMRTMLKFPFKQVDGIELSKFIAEIARSNFRKLKIKKSTVFIADASLFKEYDAYNIIYFYNPFPSAVMIEVLNSIVESIKKNDRELVIIYNNPTCDEIVVKNGVFMKMGYYSNMWGNRIYIYSNRPEGSSRLLNNRMMIRK